ncbi:energy-coupling factor transporter transmembrane protein EcfT [Arachnia propionica]|uniref:Energy-coupling factor transporter transmembrane protein EcfT n=1 Tax=Arachnia propionica TaxID=1750 RepID=A0A3P1T933_9ACTN|nr:energy-coupling factor transporter transmembrane component T [Arachnia propionica]RRD05695.1 energy-coupling factor transporter transmembrane protein EcfT [Arachnia propionica]
MNVHSSLFGLHQPGDGWLFRTHIGVKYLLMLTLVLPPLFVRQWWFTLALAVLLCGLFASSGLGPRRVLRIGWMMWLLLAMLAVFQLVGGNPNAAVTAPGNLLVAVLAARLVTLTTPTTEILDALTAVLGPLRHVGVNPERVALTVALMIRSIPYILGLFEEARDAARARGVSRNVVALLIPVVLGTVAHAERTGEALGARGLGER